MEPSTQNLVARIPTKISIGLEPLLEAFNYAQDTSSDRWDFAVEIGRLHQAGLNSSDLRWLVRKDFVKHGREVTAPTDEGREFRSIGDLTFCKKTCFVLSDSGVSHAIEADISEESWARPESELNGKRNGHSLLPHWNAEVRELFIQGLIVKRYKWKAVNQETILSAFQEDGWPAVIDDPLPPKPEQDPKRRLHDTIKALNRNQVRDTIRFHGNGTGEGIRWELINSHDLG